MGEGILFIRRNPLDLAHQVGRPRFQNGARGLGNSKKKKERGPAGHSFHRGVYPRGALWFDHTPHTRLEGSRGALVHPAVRNVVLGKGSKDGSGSNDTERKAV